MSSFFPLSKQTHLFTAASAFFRVSFSQFLTPEITIMVDGGITKTSHQSVNFPFANAHPCERRSFKSPCLCDRNLPALLAPTNTSKAPTWVSSSTTTLARSPTTLTASVNATEMSSSTISFSSCRAAPCMFFYNVGLGGVGDCLLICARVCVCPL